MARNNVGVTLVELVIVLAIIAILVGLGIVAVSELGLTSSSRVKADASNLQQFLNLARIRAIGSEYPIYVAFDATNRFYYAFTGTDTTLDTTDANGDGIYDEQENLNLPMPDTVSGVKGVKLGRDVNFGTSSSTSDSVATKRLSGTINRNSEGIYWQAGSSSDSISSGIHLSGGATRITLTRSGTATSGSIYLYLKKDEDTSYHYAISINSRGKVNLYFWDKVRGDNGSIAYRWKMVG